MPSPHNVEESFEKFLDLDPDVDDFQNVIGFYLSTDTSVENFHEEQISSLYMKLLTNRHTNAG